MGLTLDEDPGNRLPTAIYSRNMMQDDVPRAKRVVELYEQTELNEMIFGEDA